MIELEHRLNVNDFPNKISDRILSRLTRIPQTEYLLLLKSKDDNYSITGHNYLSCLLNSIQNIIDLKTGRYIVGVYAQYTDGTIESVNFDIKKTLELNKEG